MTDEWWVRLVEADFPPVRELRAPNMAKLHIALARHLVKGHVTASPAR